MKRAAVTLASLVLLASIALAQTPPTGGPGGPPRGGFAPPPFPGDSTAAERDSLMNDVMKRIAGREQAPAESVFKDIQLFKGRPAGSIARVMNYGFGRSLAVSCYHCHEQGDWAKDGKKGKRIARDMMRMVAAINDDHIAKIEGLGGPAQAAGGPERRPTVNCSTCHRGSVRASAEAGPPGPRGPAGR